MQDVERIEGGTYGRENLPDLITRLRRAGREGKAIELVSVRFDDGLDLRDFRTDGPVRLTGCRCSAARRSAAA